MMAGDVIPILGMLLSMHSCHYLWQSLSKRQVCCLSTMSTMPQVTTTPRRLCTPSFIASESRCVPNSDQETMRGKASRIPRQLYINYQPLALSNSWSSASPTTFVLWPQRRSSNLMVSPLSRTVSKRQQCTLELKLRPSITPLQNPAILILTTTILAAKILPAEIPKVYPAVVTRLSATGPNLPYRNQSIRSTDASTAHHQMQTCVMAVNLAHPVVGITPGQESAVLVIPTRHIQNGRGDVHAASHLNHHRGTDVTNTFLSQLSIYDLKVLQSRW